MSGLNSTPQDKNDEKWLPVPGFSKYEASNTGRIRSWFLPTCNGVKRRLAPLIMKQHPDRDGYPSVVLVSDDKRKLEVKTGVLVLLAFVGPRPEGLVMRHLNDVKADNYLCNLAWGTQAENIEDRWKNGTGNIGSRHGMSKLNEDKVQRIRQAKSDGANTKDLMVEFGVSRRTINRVCCGKNWKETSGPLGRMKPHPCRTEQTDEPVSADQVAVVRNLQ